MNSSTLGMMSGFINFASLFKSLFYSSILAFSTLSFISSKSSSYSSTSLFFLETMLGLDFNENDLFVVEWIWLSCIFLF